MKQEPTRRGPTERSGVLKVDRATELVTAQEIGRRVGISGRRVHDLIGEGELPQALGRIGGIRVWDWAAVEPKLRASRDLAPKRRGPAPRPS
ncbi:MAG: hypothetical protein M3Q31_19280 [Actinomycetota bacterium]|nr:hypothetical protein [Actinomycetota bacterium]